MSTETPWLDVHSVCRRARVGRKIVYSAIASGKLRAAHVDGRRTIRVHIDWADQWLTAAAPTIAEPPRRGMRLSAHAEFAWRLRVGDLQERRGGDESDRMRPQHICHAV